LKAVILAGGFGTRISEESHLKPKPMIEIGGAPIMWHILKIYSHFGVNDFIICCGYMEHVIKKYFADYYMNHSDVTFDFNNGGQMTIHSNAAEKWRVTVVNTGLDTQTGGRIKRIKRFVEGERFFVTYGDGVADIDLNELLKAHQKSNKTVTLTAVQPSGRFGVVDIDDNGNVEGFREKVQEDNAWINAGFMVMEPEVFDYIEGDSTVLEREPVEKLSVLGKLGAYKHLGFWQCMDTARDKAALEAAWNKGEAKWKVWK
jgi:glucose-1-phosphate cytidylyltransferase